MSKEQYREHQKKTASDHIRIFTPPDRKPPFMASDLKIMVGNTEVQGIENLIMDKIEVGHMVKVSFTAVVKLGQ